MTDVHIVPEGAHSPLGPSASERWLNCPGSVLASHGVPDTPTTYALEGTAAHTVSEWVRVFDTPAETYLGNIIRVTRGETHWDVPCNRAMVDSVQTFVDETALELPGEVLVEARVSYGPWVKDGFGTLDHGRMRRLVGSVKDFKHGKGVQVEATGNPQLMLYGLGIYREWDWLYGFDAFELSISQPRLKHFVEWEISVRRLLEWAADVVKPIAAKALQPGAEFKAGSWCQFCRIKNTCQTRATYIENTPRKRRIVAEEFSDLDAA